MELKAGIDTYPLPPLSRIESLVLFSGPDDPLPLVPLQVSPEEMQSLRQAAAARHGPLHLALPRVALIPDHAGQVFLVLYPPPTQDGVLRVRYYPPLMEI